jgi:transcriptional regulator with XRE-family HTH domain
MFAANVRAYRLRAKLRQVDVSEATGIPQTDISQIERGVRNVTLQTLAKIAIALDVDPRKLLKPAASPDD